VVAVAPISGCRRRRSTAIRCPTVSDRGESRSCGSVSQPGKVATEAGGRNARSAAVRSSASRAVAVTASTNRPGPPAAPLASAADSSGRSAVGATRSRSPPPGVPGWLSSAVRRWGSSATAASSPARLMLSQCRWWLGATGSPQDIRLPRGQDQTTGNPAAIPKSKPRRSASTSSLRPAGGAGSPERLYPRPGRVRQSQPVPGNDTVWWTRCPQMSKA